MTLRITLEIGDSLCESYEVINRGPLNGEPTTTVYTVNGPDGPLIDAVVHNPAHGVHRLAQAALGVIGVEADRKNL